MSRMVSFRSVCTRVTGSRCTARTVGEWLVAYYAIAKTGAVVNPISSMLTTEEVRYVVADSGAHTVVASSTRVFRCSTSTAPTPCRLSCCGATTCRPVPRPLRRGSTRRSRSSRPCRRERADLAAICYTSGTTGHPKGAMQSHRAVISAAVGTVLMGARGPEDRVINSLPLAHVYGSCVFNAAMMAGSTLVMVPRFDAEAVMAAIAEHRATLMDGVPTAYYYLLAHPDFDQADLSSLTRCWVGGQTLPAAKAIEFTERTGCPIHEVWGMTELAGAASANPVVGPNKPGTIGIAYPGNSMRVVDIDDPSVVLGRWRARRVDVPRPDGDGRLLRQRRGDQTRRSSPTAGSTPGTSPRWTRTATSRSSTARRT